MITGASSGLGESLAHSFYKAGCRIILAARRKEELERVRSDLLTKHAVRDTVMVCDIQNMMFIIQFY
jgi:dehydrogenase/reductase SDR family protein 7B